MFSQTDKLVSAIRNNVVSGLQGMHHNLSLSDELIAESIINERLAILYNHFLKGSFPIKDLYISVNCIPIDCESIDRCRCESNTYCEEDAMAHFEMPQTCNIFGDDAIDYIGSTDRMLSFSVYTSITQLKYHKRRKRSKNKPYVWVDTTPNTDGMYDCFVFNAPLLKYVSVTAIFKDLRQLDNYSCCSENSDDNMSLINGEVIDSLTGKFITYYRQNATGTHPNDQSYMPG